MPLSTYRKQGRGGKGIIGGDAREGDFLERLIIASTHDYFLFFTDQGRVYWLKVYDIPQLSRQARGRAIVNLLELKKDENITALIPVRTFEEGNLIMATAKGVVKKAKLEAYGNPKRGGIIAINLDEKDRLVGVRLSLSGEDVVLGTRNGKTIRFADKNVREMGRATHGVHGIRLLGDDEVVDIVTVSQNATLLTACQNGYGKRTAFDEYPVQGRGGQGVLDIKTEGRNGRVVSLRDVQENEDVMMITSSGMVVRTGVREISLIGRNTQGVRLIGLEENDRLVSVAPVAEEEEGGAGEGEVGEEVAEEEEVKEGEGEEGEK
jgi:DNA gyrase subunit A